MNKQQMLVTRWLTPEGSNLAIQVKTLLQNKDVSTLQKVVDTTPEGYLDLRYCPIKFTSETKNVGLELANADFSGAVIGSLISENCAFQNCHFDGAQFSIFNERSCIFENVSFKGVDFRGAGIGLYCSKYTNVDFTRSDLRGTSFYSPQFVNCKFDHAKLNCVDFRASNFIDCVFSGKLKSIWFNKYYRFPGDEEEYGKAPVNEMLNVDFSDAILWNVMFTGGVDLSSVKLPSDNTHLLVKRFGLALSKISFDDVPESQREELAFRTRMYAITARRQPMYILNKAEIIKRMGKESGEVFISKLIDADKNLL